MESNREVSSINFSIIGKLYRFSRLFIAIFEKKNDDVDNFLKRRQIIEIKEKSIDSVDKICK